MFETAHATRHVAGATEKKMQKNKGAKQRYEPVRMITGQWGIGNGGQKLFES